MCRRTTRPRKTRRAAGVYFLAFSLSRPVPLLRADPGMAARLDAADGLSRGFVLGLDLTPPSLRPCVRASLDPRPPQPHTPSGIGPYRQAGHACRMVPDPQGCETRTCVPPEHVCARSHTRASHTGNMVIDPKYSSIPPPRNGPLPSRAVSFNGPRAGYAQPVGQRAISSPRDPAGTPPGSPPLFSTPRPPPSVDRGSPPAPARRCALG